MEHGHAPRMRAEILATILASRVCVNRGREDWLSLPERYVSQLENIALLVGEKAERLEGLEDAWSVESAQALSLALPEDLCFRLAEVCNTLGRLSQRRGRSLEAQARYFQAALEVAPPCSLRSAPKPRSPLR